MITKHSKHQLVKIMVMKSQENCHLVEIMTAEYHQSGERCWCNLQYKRTTISLFFFKKTNTECFLLKGPKIVNNMIVPLLERSWWHFFFLLVWLAFQPRISNHGNDKGAKVPQLPKAHSKAGRLPPKYQGSDKSASCKKPDFQAAHISTNHKNA